MSTDDGAISVGGVSASLALETDKFEAQLGRAYAGLDRTAAALKRLDADLKANLISQGDYDARMAKLTADQQVFTQAIRDTNAELARLAAASNSAATATTALRSGLAGSGQALLQTGRVVQDFAQGGLGGILNNIEGLTRSLGGTAGLAGILTVVGVGFMLLKPHIQAFIDSLGSGESGVKTFSDVIKDLEKHLKEISDKSNKISLDYHEIEDAERALERLKSGQAAFEAGRKAKTDQQEQRGQILRDAVDNSAGGNDAISGVENLARFLMDARRANEAAGVKDSLVGEDSRVAGARDKLEKAQQALDDTMNAGGDPAFMLGVVENAQEELRRVTDAAANDLGKAFGFLAGRIREGTSEVDRAKVEAEVARHPELARRAGITDRFRQALRLAAPENLLTPEDKEEGERRAAREKGQKPIDAEEAKEEKRLGRQLNKEEREALAAKKKDEREMDAIRKAHERQEAQERKQEVARRARAFEANEMGDEALEGDLDRRRVKGMMIVSGDSEEKAEELADDVLEAVQAHVQDKIKARAISELITPEAARRELVAEAKEKRARKEDAEAERVEKKGRETLPGVGRIAEDEIFRRRLAGQAPDIAVSEAATRIAEALKARGLAPEDARTAAGRIAEEAGGDVQEKAVKTVLEGDRREAKHSEVIGAGDFSRTIQESISGGAGDKQLAEIREVQKILRAQLLVNQQFANKKFEAVLK